MPDIGQDLRVLVSKTSSGDGHYLQITSADGFSVNIVLIAPAICIDDRREDP